MSELEYCLLALALFAAGLTVDYAGTRHQQSVTAGKRNRAALWSGAQWCCAMVGFVVGVRCSLWLLPAEALGLMAGTWLAVDDPVPEARSRRRWRERGS